MGSSNLKRRKRTKRSFLFRGKTGKSVKSRRRQFAEAVLMLIVGFNLVGFLNTLPRSFIVERLSKETLVQLTSSFINIVNSLTSIGVSLVVILLLIVSLILIIGGICRILILLSNKKSVRASRNNISSR